MQANNLGLTVSTFVDGQYAAITVADTEEVSSQYNFDDINKEVSAGMKGTASGARSMVTANAGVIFGVTGTFVILGLGIAVLKSLKKSK